MIKISNSLLKTILVLTIAFSSIVNAQNATHLNFDGINDIVDIGTTINSTLDNTNTFTVEANVKPTSSTGNGVIIGNHGTGSDGAQFLLRRDTNNFVLYIDFGTGLNAVVASGITLNAWQHIAATWDGTNIKIYVNGILKNTASAVGTSFKTSTDKFTIGDNNGIESFKGDIDEVRVWTKVRTASEILADSDKEVVSPQTDLLAYYQFNQGTNNANNTTITTLTDNSGNTHNGTLQNFTLTGLTSNWNSGSTILTGSADAAPTIATLNPTDDATNVSISTDLTLTFSENILKGTGDIIIYDASDDSAVETIDVTTTNVTVSNAVATINPTADLVNNKTYYIQIAPTAFKDATNNNFAGITDKTTYNFTTIANTTPTFTSTPITTVNENTTYTYTITTNDADNDDVTITATTKPSWLNLITNIDGQVSTFAGSGANGNLDGIGVTASFSSPFDLVSDVTGNIYIADPGYDLIRKITPTGNVTTFAGSGNSGSTDATGIAASFNDPRGIAIDNFGNIYVADSNNHIIRKITPAGVVTTFAGSGNLGSADGLGTAASFRNPYGLVVDSSNNIYVADTRNNKIRKITPLGIVTTLAGSGNLGSTDATGTAASFVNPSGITIDDSGNLYIADTGNHKIRKITPAGMVTTIAGSGTIGNTDATSTAASFNYPDGIAIDSNGNIYIADSGNHKIRKITSEGIVITFAGSGVSGSIDATGAASNFFTPSGITIDSNGKIYVADTRNNKIRKITTSNTKLSGDTTGQVGNHSVVLQADDNKGGITTQSFSINVAAVTYAFFNTGNWSDSSKWSPSLPVTTGNTLIANNATATLDIDDMVIKDLTIHSGSTLIIPNDKEITVTGNLQLEGTLTLQGNAKVITTGNFTINSSGATTLATSSSITVNGNFENNGSSSNVILESDVNNSSVLLVNGTANGDIRYKRNGLFEDKWSLISSPLNNYSLSDLAFDPGNNIRKNTSVTPNRFAIGYYDDTQTTGNKWMYYNQNNINTAGSMVLGKAYSVSRGSDGLVMFVGNINTNSIQNSNNPEDTWLAIGNPFTTYFPANKNGNSSFLSDNLANLATSYKSIYMWDVAQNKYIAVTETDTNNRTLAPGQGFFVKTRSIIGEITNNVPLVINENKRQLKPSSGNTTFSKSEVTPEIKLHISSNNNIVTTYIKYFDTATNGLDPGYDIGNFNGAEIDIYTHLLENSEGINYTIQSLPKNNYDNTIIPIGIKAPKDVEITFNTEDINLPANIKIFLEDKKNNSFIRLNETNSNYSANLEESLNGIGRFYLHTTTNVLNIDTVNLENISIYKPDASTLRIVGLQQGNTNVTLFNILGKRMMNTFFQSNGVKDISLPKLVKGVYFLQLQTDTGKINKKIILE